MLRIAGLLVIALAAAGCSTVNQITGSINQFTGPSADLRGTTVAFESIDGAPPAVAQKITRELGSEATARELVVVPGGGTAMYRVRGYLAAQTEQGRTAIVWAWDIYDGEQRRVFRLRGEDRVAGGRAWTAADDQTWRRIARASVEQLVAYLGSPRAPASAALDPAGSPSPSPGGSILAGLDDFRPEAAGIFRILRQAPVPLALDPAPEAAPHDVPLPPGRPAPEAVASASLAFADPAR